jgi:hypothetical protein
MKKNKTKHFLFLFFLIIFKIKSEVEPTPEEISKLGFKDLPILATHVENKKARPRFKILVMERMNIVLLENKSKLNENGKELIGILSNLLDNNPDSESSYYPMIRKKSCFMLGNFRKTNFEEDAYDRILQQIKNETNLEVTGTCLGVMVNFDNYKDKTNKILIELTKVLLKKKRLDDEDSDLMQSIINGFAELKFKSSYIPLMKVLDSKFPVEIKNSAKEVLETLPN